MKRSTNQLLAQPVLSVPEAAELLQVNPARVRAMIAAGILAAAKLGGRWLVSAQSVEKRQQAGTQPGRLLGPRRAERRAVEEGDQQRRVNVGFALMTLQRRLASSPEAIFKSIERRRERLEAHLRDGRLQLRGHQAEPLPLEQSDWLDEDELDDFRSRIRHGSSRLGSRWSRSNFLMRK